MPLMLDTVKVTGEWLFYLDGKLVRREKNLLVQVGLNYLASWLANETTNDVPVHLALGTGTTAPAASDTKLESEQLRKDVSSITRQANIVRFRTFFLASEANSTWTECGVFLAGTNNANSGTLLNRITPTGGISKSGNTVLTIEVRITLSAG